MLTNLPLLPLGQQAVAVLTGFATDFSRLNGTLSYSAEREERVISLCRNHLLQPLTSLPLDSVAVVRLLAKKAPERAEEWARELAEFPWLLFRCGRDLADIAASVYDPTNDSFRGSFGDISKDWLKGAIELGDKTHWQTLLTLRLDPPRAFAPAISHEGREDGVVSIADRQVSRFVQEAVDQRDFARAFELMDTLTQQIERGEVGPYTATSLYEIARMAFLESALRSEFATGVLEVLRGELGIQALLALASLRDERVLKITGILLNLKRYLSEDPADHQLGFTAIQAVNPSMPEILIPLEKIPFDRPGARNLGEIEGSVKFERTGLRSGRVDPEICRLVIQVLWRGGGFGQEGQRLFEHLLSRSQYDLTVQPPAYEAEFGQDNAGRPVLRVTAARERSEVEVDMALLRLAASYGKASAVFALLRNNSRLVASHIETVAALRPFGLTYEESDAEDLRHFRGEWPGMHSDFVRFHFLEQSLRYGAPGIRQEAALEVIQGKLSAAGVIAYLDRRSDLQEMVVSGWVQAIGEDPNPMRLLSRGLFPERKRPDKPWESEKELDPDEVEHRAPAIPEFVWKYLPEPLRDAFVSYFVRLLGEGYVRIAEVLKAIGTSDAVTAVVDKHRSQNQYWPHQPDRETLEKVLVQLATDGNQQACDYLSEIARTITSRLVELHGRWWNVGKRWSNREERGELQRRLLSIGVLNK